LLTFEIKLKRFFASGEEKRIIWTTEIRLVWSSV